MKKVISLVFLFLTVFVLVACKPSPTPPDDEDDTVTITYAAWNLGTLSANGIERRMIAAFEDAYPDIKVDIIERPTVVNEDGSETDLSWDEFFATQAAVGRMPDVYQVDSVIKSVTNGWAEDIYDLAFDDDEFLLVPEDIRNAALLNNKLYALPQALFYIGYFINRTAIDETGAGAIIPEYGITYSDLMHAASVNRKAPVDGGDGIAGINGVEELMGWLPAQYDASLGWFTYNEDGFHFDSPAFAAAVAEQSKFYLNPGQYANYVLEAQQLAHEARLVNNPEDTELSLELWYGAGNPFENGNQSIRFAPSYNMRNWVQFTQTENHALFGHDIDFIGTPSVMVEGDLVHRIPVVLDYIAVGRGTEHQEEAYLFAKWMGFGVDGYAKRLEIATEYPEAGAVNFAPMVPDQELLDAYFALYPTMTEYRKIVESHQDFIVESIAKTVPGYAQVRWTGDYNAELNMWGIFNEISRGGTSILAQALQAGLNNLANQYWQEAKDALDEATQN